jgi:hypothetical protein
MSVIATTARHARRQLALTFNPRTRSMGALVASARGCGPRWLRCRVALLPTPTLVRFPARAVSRWQWAPAMISELAESAMGSADRRRDGFQVRCGVSTKIRRCPGGRPTIKPVTI